jgi:hypothetical protein
MVSCGFAWGAMLVGSVAPMPAWGLAPEASTERGDDPKSPPPPPPPPIKEEEEEEEEEDDAHLLEEVIGATVVFPQDEGEIQLNLAPSYTRERGRGGRHIGRVGYEIEVGATDWLQFDVEWTAPTILGGAASPTAVGIGDVELGTQLTWMRMRGSPWSGALAFEATVPVSREESDFSEGTFTYEPYITLAVDPPAGRAQVFTNLGVEVSSEALQPFVNAGVIGAASLTRPHLVVSYSGTEAYVVPGVSLVLPAGWSLVMGVSVGLSRASDPIGVGLVLIYEINPLERRGQ